MGITPNITQEDLDKSARLHKLSDYLTEAAELLQNPYRSNNVDVNYRIARIFEIIDREKLAEDVDRFGNAKSYIHNQLPVGQATVYNYIKVARKFLKEGSSECVFSPLRFSVTQLSFMCKVPWDTCQTLVSQGVLRPDMSNSDIDYICNKYKNGGDILPEDLNPVVLLEERLQGDEESLRLLNRIKMLL